MPSSRAWNRFAENGLEVPGDFSRDNSIFLPFQKFRILFCPSNYELRYLGPSHQSTLYGGPARRPYSRLQVSDDGWFVPETGQTQCPAERALSQEEEPPNRTLQVGHLQQFFL